MTTPGYNTVQADGPDCPDLMSDQEAAYLETWKGPTFVAWELADRWLRWWRERHPDDPRDDLELLMEVYGR